MRCLCIFQQRSQISRPSLPAIGVDHIESQKFQMLRAK